LIVVAKGKGAEHEPSRYSAAWRARDRSMIAYISSLHTVS